MADFPGHIMNLFDACPKGMTGLSAVPLEDMQSAANERGDLSNSWDTLSMVERFRV